MYIFCVLKANQSPSDYFRFIGKIVRFSSASYRYSAPQSPIDVIIVRPLEWSKMFSMLALSLSVK